MATLRAKRTHVGYGAVAATVMVGRMSDVAEIGPGGRGRGPRPLLRRLIGDVLRRHRLAQRRTLADVARHARVSVPYLSEVERGRKEVSSEVLAAVCDALRIELSDLLTDVGRDLARDRTPTVRLETVHSEPARLDAVRLEAARLTAARRRHNVGPKVGGPRPARGSGDVVLLAA